MKYKNILWIDDVVTNDSGYEGAHDNDEDEEIDDFLLNEQNEITKELEPIELIRPYFPKNYKDVKLITQLQEALEELENNSFKYDIIVFDINLEDGFPEIEFLEICKKLKEKRIYVPDEYAQFKIKAGMYLYLFLLNCGYPNNRMVILTGNKDSLPKEFLKKAHIEPIDDRDDEQRFIIYKNSGELDEGDKEWISSFYKDKYYQVRKLVYKACEYWNEKIQNSLTDDIAFNQIYYCNAKKDDSDSGIEPEVFISMLKRIEMLFPVAKPQNCEELYYQALQVVTMFHEESANISSISDEDNNRSYHQAIRNFRNWAAHNKFVYNKIDADLFAYLFCITLRSYFQEKDNQFVLIEQCYDVYEYENEYFEKFDKEEINVDTLKNNYIYAFKRHICKLKNIDIKSKKKNIKDDRIPVIYECENINSILLKSGKVLTSKNQEKMYLTDLLLNIIDVLISNTRKTGKELSNNRWEYRVEYSWNTKIDIDNLQVKIESADFFKCIAYYLFTAINEQI